MSAQQRIQSALDAIDSARRTLRRLEAQSSGDTELKRALRNLDEAAEHLLRARRDSQE